MTTTLGILGGAACLIGSLALASASPGAGGTKIPKGFSKDQLYGTTLRKAKWNRLAIEVCWENVGKVAAQRRAMVQAVVAQTWEKASDVRFQGWTACASQTAPGLHILVGEEPPYTEAVGRYLDARESGMHLSFDVVSWRPECASDAERCIRAVIVHEFGHALGFTHEQLKPGVPAECSSEPRDIVGDYLVTVYDPSSVMNMCNAKWNGDGQLSALDGQAVRRFYSS